MALLFHGTIGEDTVRAIFREGLRPSKGEGSSKSHWAHRLTGSPRDRLVFMSTSPVSGKGGDPVAFAMGWPLGRASRRSGEPGFIVVVDLPSDALGGVRAVVPNGELDAFIELCWLKDHLSDGRSFLVILQMVRSLLARRVPLDSASVGRELEVRIKRVDPDLGVEGELTAGRWAQFFEEYARLLDVRSDDFSSSEDLLRERSKLLRRYGLRFPSYIEEDGHSVSCSLCAGGLVELAIGVRGEALDLSFSAASPVGRMLGLEGGLADFVRVVGGQLARPLPEAVDAVLRERGGTISLAEFFASVPADGGRLPPIWRPGYGRSFSGKDFGRPDHQVVAEAVDARHVLGAIALSSGGRLLGRFERGRGRAGTLASQLWGLAHDLRDGRGGAAGPAAGGASYRRII
jgi:hypothetical protein